MSETPDGTHAPSSFVWSRALVGGLMATVVMTVVLMLTGMNVMKMLGAMIAPAAGVAMQYVIGSIVHLMIGLFYGLAYAWLVGRVSERNRFVKGTVYGLAIAAIAFAVMPIMSAMAGGNGGAANPCGGVSASASAAANPCHPGNPCARNQPSNPSSTAQPGNPCAAKNPCVAKNPCAAHNPCAGAKNPCAAKNPCSAKNPCAGKPATATGQKAANACHVGANPCGGSANPSNPCGGSGGPYSDAMSVLNHLAYALTLAFVYGRGR